MGEKSGDNRLEVYVGGADIHEHADEALESISAFNDPTWPWWMVRGNDLVRNTERGELEPFTVDSLRDDLSRIVFFWQYNKKGKVEQVKPPPEIAKLILARDSGEYRGIARVDRVVDVPVLGAKGELIATPGHHIGSRILYRPDSDLKLSDDVGAFNTDEEGIRAREFLMDDLLGDFGFEDEASKANALGLLLLPFVREYIGDRPTPMHLITAPEVGSGKTLLALAALIPGCGLVDVTGEAHDEDEIRKRITAQLLAGKAAIIFDNLAGSITSSVLAGAITTGKWSDRKLGESREVRLPIRNAWVATGNNIELTDEHNRRTVPIILDPGEVTPYLRNKEAFRHADLIEWALANRGKLVEAALTLVRNWREGGEVRSDGEVVPFSSERTMGTFERWAEVIGGILKAAGVKGFLGNRDKLVAVNPEREAATAFLHAWYDLGRGPQTFEQVCELCVGVDRPLHAHMPDELRIVSGEKFKVKMLYWLRDHKGAKYGGLKLVKVEGRPARWEIVNLSDAQSHQTDGRTSIDAGVSGDSGAGSSV